MANEWDAIWVRYAVNKEVYRGDLYGEEDFREALDRYDQSLIDYPEAGGWTHSLFIEKGYEDDPVDAVVRVERRKTPEEIEAEKKAIWEKGSRAREERDLKEYQRLKEKFKNLSQNLL